jgi:hypothetical protein
MGLAREELFEAASDHNGLGVVSDHSDLYHRIVAFFKQITTEAPNQVSVYFKETLVPDASTLRTRSSVGGSVKGQSQSKALPHPVY